MTDRLKGCDRWHPDMPARFAMRKTPADKDTRQCLECMVCRIRAHRDEKRATAPYRVLPRLTWAPPKILDGLYS